MISTKTLVWIIASCLGVCVLAVCALAGTGIYFVTQHIATQHTTTGEALHELDAARARFKGKPPLLELDRRGQFREVRRTEDMATSSVKPQDMMILAWNPDRGRVVRVALPFWILHFGRRKIDVLDDNGNSLDIDSLNIDINELERIGPAFVLDFSTPKGERVLIWTQ